MPRLLALVLWLVVLALRPGVGEARPQTDRKLAREAKKHVKAGLKHYKRGKMDKAIEELQVAYSLDPVPIVLFHIAEAHNSKKEYKEALYYYRQYAKEEPKAAKRRGVPEIIEALAAMEETGGETAAEVKEPPPAPPEPPPPAAAPAEPAPPPATEPAPDLTARAPAGDGGGGGLRLAAYIAAGAGVVLVGTGGYFAWVAHKREGELSDLFAEEGQWSQRYQDKWDQGESARTRAIWLSAAGGAALASGVVLYLLGRPDGERSVEVSAAPARGGGEVMARWAF